MIRRRSQTAAVPAALRAYLQSGDYGGGDVETFILAGQVLRGRLTGLRAAWTEHGAVIAAEWNSAAPPFAFDVLENVDEGDMHGVLAILAGRRASPR
jgi:hypothetical protein